MGAGHVDQIADFLPHRLLPLQVVEVTGVVAELLHERGDLLRQPVVFLKIDHQVRIGAGDTNIGQGSDVLGVINRDTNHVRAGKLQQLDLADRRRYVLRARCCHRLNGDRVRPADAEIADTEFARGSWFHAGCNSPPTGSISGTLPRSPRSGRVLLFPISKAYSKVPDISKNTNLTICRRPAGSLEVSS